MKILLVLARSSFEWAEIDTTSRLKLRHHNHSESSFEGVSNMGHTKCSITRQSFLIKQKTVLDLLGCRHLLIEVFRVTPIGMYLEWDSGGWHLKYQHVWKTEPENSIPTFRSPWSVKCSTWESQVSAIQNWELQHRHAGVWCESDLIYWYDEDLIYFSKCRKPIGHGFRFSCWMKAHEFRIEVTYQWRTDSKILLWIFDAMAHAEATYELSKFCNHPPPIISRP